ncbi:MAG: hypothetical protein JST00_16760 [Deltaproteobacteria bacterium]|nr:hypothetical protein [Deltaproteobacteria bacterium]
MRVRFGFLAGCAGVIGLVIACGSSDGGGDPVTPTGDASPEGSTLSDATAPDAANDTTTSGPCDPASAAACGARKCDVALGCVDCISDGDCTAAGRDPFCILGRCEACRTNNDCGTAQPVCLPADHRCGSSCIGDAAVTCRGDAPLCNTTTGACVGCRTASDCPATSPICEPTTSQCVACTQSSQCPAARPKCDLGRFECVQCVINADCPAGQACDGEGRCIVKCTADTQCTNPNRAKCNVATGACVECLDATQCAGKAATPICDTNRSRCVQCVTNAQCGDGGTPFCKDSECIQCRNDNDCAPADKCDKGTCVAK